MKRILTFALLSFIPFFVVFIFFIIYPLAASLSMMFMNPEVITELFSDELYIRAFYNTLVFVGVAIPLKLTAALFLSGFLSHFRKYSIVKVVGVLYLLPWALPAVPAALSFRWSLNYDFGLFNKFLTDLGLPKIPWLLTYPTAMASIIIFHVWKWLPQWTLLLYAGRQSIPDELYEAAKIDGASLWSSFTDITFPLLKKLFVICMVLSSIWSIGEFEAIWLVTMAGPNQATHTITTLGFNEVFQFGNFVKGVSVYMSVLPLISALLLVLIMLFRR